MKTLKLMPKITAILFLILGVTSCDEDFNTIGTDIIGDDSLLTQTNNEETVIAYSRKLDPIQTNFIEDNQLGFYNDPVFGKSTVNYISQLLLKETDPIFGDTLGQPLEIENVILYIPYYSVATVEEEETTYVLDSIFGSAPVKISIYESNFFLRDLDPDANFEEAQLYYSNQGAMFEANKGELWATIEDFVPDDEGYILVEGEGDDEIETLIAPGIRIELPIEYFQEKIIDKEGDPVLSNNNNFKEYLRGIYLKVETLSEEGNLFIFNSSKATISINYTYEKPVLDSSGNEVLDEEGNPEKEITDDKVELNFSGIDLNVFDNELSLDVESDLANPNTIEGEETLYVRGGEGVLTVIDLFGEDADNDGVPEDLEELRANNWLINDANLIFYVDQNKVEGGETEPERLTIYNLETNNILVDYFLDTTSGEDDLNALNIHLGRLKRGSDENGEYYKIRITNHLSNVITKDSTNVSLGLIVSQNVLLSGFQTVDSLTNPQGNLPRIKKVPRSSVLSPEGTVLYGNNTPNEEKRLKLEIRYIDLDN